MSFVSLALFYVAAAVGAFGAFGGGGAELVAAAGVLLAVCAVRVATYEDDVMFKLANALPPGFATSYMPRGWPRRAVVVVVLVAIAVGAVAGGVSATN